MFFVYALYVHPKVNHAAVSLLLSEQQYMYSNISTTVIFIDLFLYTGM